MGSLQQILSGGQTGVDRAALDVALALKIPCGGWCPKNRRAEDGMIPPRYPLKETPTEDYLERTEWNVRDSDGTLILTFGPPTTGTAYTIEHAKKLGRPCLIFDLDRPCSKERFLDWLGKNQIKILNVAGPRESHRPGAIYSTAKEVLTNLFFYCKSTP